MEITNGEIKVDLPETLAKLLIENRDWEKAGGRKRAAADADDAAIPMTHIPGVVPGISMNRLKKLVADGVIPHVLDNRTRLVKPSDVRAALESQ